MEKKFLSDIQEIRRRARMAIQEGAVTPSYPGDLETVIRLLNEALATEIVCTLRYKSHYFMAEGIHAKAATDEFKEHAAQEQEHADWLAARIRQLGGTPNFHPEGILLRSHSEFQSMPQGRTLPGEVTPETLLEMIQEDLIAERIAIESYSEMIRYIGDKDPTSRRLLERILETEEEHAEDMAGLLANPDLSRGSQNTPRVA